MLLATHTGDLGKGMTQQETNLFCKDKIVTKGNRFQAVNDEKIIFVSKIRD